MQFMDAVKMGLARYQDFTGRSSRSEFWWFALAMFLLGFVLSIFPILLGRFGSVIELLIVLVAAVPGAAVTIRRAHDLDRTGLWTLLYLVPLGTFVIAYFAAQPGTVGANQYGSDPLAAPENQTI